MAAGSLDPYFADAARRLASQMARSLGRRADHVDAAHALLSLKGGFTSQYAVWAVLLTSLRLLCSARDAASAAQAEEQAIERVSAIHRQTMHRLRIGHPVAVARIQRPAQRPRGRRNETALRDLVVDLLLDLTPSSSPVAAKWEIAVAIARFNWPGIPAAEELKRDMRRRAARGPVFTRETSHFYKRLAQPNSSMSRVSSNADHEIETPEAADK